MSAFDRADTNQTKQSTVSVVEDLLTRFDGALIDSNPCRRVRKFRTDPRRTLYLTFDEEARLFEKLEVQEWVQRMVTMAINTGMRPGETFDLTWLDVDLMRGLLHVRVSKNGKDRLVPINQTIRTMLE